MALCRKSVAVRKWNENIRIKELELLNIEYYRCEMISFLFGPSFSSVALHGLYFLVHYIHMPVEVDVILTNRKT